jgi:hypothetical protein
MTSDATNGTMEKDKRIATMKMTIRHAKLILIPPPSPGSGFTRSNVFSLLFASEQP